MLTLMLIRIFFLLFSLIAMCNTNQIRFVEVIKNQEFDNKRITEQQIKTTRKVKSTLECVVECKKLPSCLSFTFNDNLKVCDMFDQDFVHVTETRTIDETGWNYYYVVPGNKIDKSKCELPAVGICHSFCFFYRNGFWSNTARDFKKACSVKGGEVIKVDRYLKQYCMGEAVEDVIGTDNMVINGQQSEATGEWTYYDGPKITYFYWDTKYDPPEPDYYSPVLTPGEYQGTLASAKAYHYMWFDYSDWAIEGVLCEIL